jgi:predicted HicB family RNase H-like nuclease
MMRHGKYFAEIEYDDERGSFYGRAVNVLTGGFDFWGSSVEELRREFATSARVFEEVCAEEGIEIEVTDAPKSASRAAAALGRRKSTIKAETARANGRMGGRPARDPRELLRALIADGRYREHGVEEIDGQSVHWMKYGDRPRVYGNTQEEMVRKAFRLYKPAQPEAGRLKRSA